MKRLTCCLAWMFLLIGAVAAQDKEVKLKIVQTSDIHGNFYPHDFTFCIITVSGCTSGTYCANSVWSTEACS